MSLSIAEHKAQTPVLSGAASVYLDGVRALAANLVVLSHIFLIYDGGGGRQVGASMAVSLFFLLSGFLIAQSMFNWQRRPEPRLPGFLADRVARIATPYVPALLLVALVDALFIGTKWGEPGVNTGVRTLLGNLLMLQDHSLFRLLEMLPIDRPWRVLPYNTAEPFWTVSIEMWIYVSGSLFFFCLLCRERVRRRYLWSLVALSFPVVVWNAAAGGGKSLTLIWLLGAAAGVVLIRPLQDGSKRARWLAFWLVSFGAGGLAGRVAKIGFDGFDLQTVALAALVMFGVLVGLSQVRAVPSMLERGCRFFASYSYSLYLIHNTVLVVVWEATSGAPRWLSILSGVLMAHLVALALYLAFERHHRHVGRWLRPRFEHALLPRREAVASSRPVSLPSAARSRDLPCERTPQAWAVTSGKLAVGPDPVDLQGLR